MSEQSKILAKDKSKNLATQNLKIKLKILNDFINNGIPWQRDESGSYIRDQETGARLLDFYPKSALQFSRWTSNGNNPGSVTNCTWVRNELQNQYGSFTSHGQDSLSHKNRPQEYAQAIKMFDAIKEVARHQRASEHNADVLAEQKNEISRWKAAAEAQATFVTHALMEKGELEMQVGHLKRALDESKRVFAESMAAKDALIAILKKEIRESSRFKDLAGV